MNFASSVNCLLTTCQPGTSLSRALAHNIRKAVARVPTTSVTTATMMKATITAVLAHARVVLKITPMQG